MNHHLLSQSEINHYHDQGFLIPQMTLEGSEIEELKHAVDRVLEANSGIRPEQLISVHVDRLNDEESTEIGLFLNWQIILRSLTMLNS
ncbi:MAG: hypothetical protein VX003_08815 [SAR324 cluster bacterium]|nr:hypothetical protein [SAR324 cluster bacterium]